jgi:uncharacterized alkaline shock family protein YloU
MNIYVKFQRHITNQSKNIAKLKFSTIKSNTKVQVKSVGTHGKVFHKEHSCEISKP